MEVTDGELYLIEILHQTTTTLPDLFTIGSCILLKFYIKPQLRGEGCETLPCCILLKFYIKPQHTVLVHAKLQSCILLKFYIKPQQIRDFDFPLNVVSY